MEKAVEDGSGAWIDGIKKKIIRVQHTNEMFQNVSGFKIWENILTGFHSFALAKPEKSGVCF